MADVPSQIIVRMPMNVVLSVVLSLFFGPLGMLNSTVAGAITMLFITSLVDIPTLGFGLLVSPSGMAEIPRLAGEV
jgi:hypothetical protein